ncbi:MAG: PH domain-containing protein [Sarcina sp.]
MANSKDEILYRSVVISVIVKIFSFMLNWFFMYLILINEPIMLVIMTLVVLVYYIVAIKYEYIKITTDEVFYNRGIIFKKSLRIHKERLKAIDISKNIVGRIFSFSTIKIETAVMGDMNDTTIRMYLSDKKISEIKTYLLELESVKEDSEEDTDIKVQKVENIIHKSTMSNKDLFIGGLTSAGFFVVVFAVFQGAFFLTEIGQEDALNSTVDFAINSISDLHIGFLFGIFLLSFILINIAVGIINIVKFYNFTLTVTEEKINIKYGLLNVREFSFVRKDIKAVVINSNPIRQMFGYSDIKLDVKGYNGFGDAAIMLAPFIKNTHVDKVFDNILSDFIIKEEIQTFEKAKAYYILKPVLINLLISIVLLVLFKDPYVLLWNVLSIFSIVGRNLIIRNTELSFNNKVLRGVYGGFYKVEKRIRPRDLQAIQVKSTRFLERLGIGNILIYYYSEVGGGLCLRHLNKDNLQKLSRISRGLGVDTNEDKQNECYENIR